MQDVVPHFLEVVHVHLAGTVAVCQHAVCRISSRSSRADSMDPVVCMCAQDLRFAVVSCPNAEVPALELVGGHDLNAVNLFIVALLNDSFDVRLEIAQVHGAEGLDVGWIPDIYSDFTLGLSHYVLGILWIVCAC